MSGVAVSPRIEESWGKVLTTDFQSAQFLALKQFLLDEIEKKIQIYPPPEQIFSAFEHTPFDKVKVVILGQDPYHGARQANGLCFSVSPGISQPPSLQNIFKELHDDLGIPIPKTGDLTSWANQGVLLLNAILTVRAGEAASHQGKGWEDFTDAAIRKLSTEKEGIVFLLWGKYAQEKGKVIDRSKHFVLEAAHPSPFSVHSGFFGCKHFSVTNAILEKIGKTPIDWRIE
ncbi:uracil-DNA glycosylase [Candidatus Peregrinibacteria bacterium]|nr:uracil-DNA glycosylase [Candidatus Peregrinibacteria bacterium]